LKEIVRINCGTEADPFGPFEGGRRFMTKLGRRLVFVLVSLSLTLMGISMAVNATSTDWKSKLKEQSDAKGKLTSRLDMLNQRIEVEVKELEDAKSLNDFHKRSYGDRIAKTNAEVLKTKRALESVHAEYLDAQSTFKKDLIVQEETTAKLKRMQAQLAALQKQKAAFDEQNDQLTEMVGEMQRTVAELERAAELLKANSSGGD
jgi:chromosome segregation ATPase